MRNLHSSAWISGLVLSVILSGLGTTRAQEAKDLPLLLNENFTRGFSAWKTTDASAWEVKPEEGSSNRVLNLHGKSNYKPTHRSPFNQAILKYHTVGDFVLTAKLQATKESYGHRDLCLFFGYQDPDHFYYVHLGQKMDDHANQIFIVNDAPRTKISETTTEGTPWKDGSWHNVKIVREVESGLIEVYFDDMTKPVMTAHDKTFDWGKIGVGSFDDTGMFDDVILHGIEVKPKGDHAVADPKTLKYEKWTTDYEIHNAIALSFDEKGAAYVTGARRRVAQDLAIREDWMIEDLKLRSVEDKKAFYHRVLNPDKGTSEENKANVEDHNQDGSHDWRDLMVLSDTIYRIEDTTGDGKANKKTAYATGIQTEITGSMAGVLYHDGDVYATASPELMKFRDNDGDGVSDEQKSIAHGFGVHVAYAGHYMHGLNVGPDGRLYWTIGDKGINVLSKEGKRFEYPHEGVMMRCEPDGSNFEVYVRGLRNLQEPRFDAYGNWFGVDNDGDSAGEMERLVYLAQHIDTGWRINWQYFKGDYNFWTTEGLFKPWFEGQAGHIVPTIASYVNGPSGFAWNPGTALSPEYKNYFFITQFSSGFQNAFQVKPKGASFEMINDHVIGNGVPLVGLNWSPDGGLYGTDWGGGYTLNDKGGVWRIDVPEYADSKERKETATLLGEGMTDRDEAELVTLLDQEDQRVRLAAQFELVKRGEQALLETSALKKDRAQMGRIHALWGWAQLERAKAKRNPGKILTLAKDEDPEIRAQFARTIGDIGAIEGDATVDALIAMLSDSNERAQSLAALSLGNLEATRAYPALLTFADGIRADQPYLRHGATVALTHCAQPEQLAGLSQHESTGVRRAAVIALRRQGAAGVAEFLDDTDEAIATDAARAIHDDDSILPALPQLAAALTTTKYENEAFLRRAVNANFRLGDSASASRLATFASNKNRPLDLRLDALDALTDWAAPAEIDRIEGSYRKLEPRDLKKTGEAVGSEMTSLLADPETVIQEAAMKMASTLGVIINPDALASVVNGAKNPENLRREALSSLAAQKAEQLPEAVETALASDSAPLRTLALTLLSGYAPGPATTRAAAILENINDIPEAQSAVTVLAKLATPEADAILAKQTEALVDGTLNPNLLLDVITAAQARTEAVPAIAASLAAYEKTRKPGDLVDSHRECLEGGDAMKGEDIFMNHIAAQCVRCHNYTSGKGSTIGPNLKAIGAQKDRAYLLESIVNPQAVIAPGYGTISLTLKNGDTVAGQFRKETRTEIEIRDAENKPIMVPVDQVKERTPVVSTMPPMFALLKKGEIRDVVAYLAGLRGE